VIVLVRHFWNRSLVGIDDGRRDRVHSSFRVLVVRLIMEARSAFLL